MSELSFDPRENIPHDLSIGQVYEDCRTEDRTKLVYLDESVSLLRDEDGHHRLNTRKAFESNVGSGRLKYLPDAENFGYAGSMERVLQRAEEYEAEGGRKNEHYADAMREAIEVLTESTLSLEPVPFEDLDGIGPSTASALRDAGYETVADVRRSGNDDLLAVSGVGEANLESIRYFCRAD